MADPPVRALRGSPSTLRQYRDTFLTEVLVLVLLLALIKIASVLLTKEEFGEFMVVRSLLTLIYPAVLLGLGVALPRFIAKDISVESPSREFRHLDAALVAVALALVPLGFLCAVFPSHVAAVLFGDSSHRALSVPFFLLVATFAFHALAYAHFRGRLDFRRANLLQVINTSAVPVVSLLVTRSVPEYFFVTAAGWATITSVALCGAGFRPAVGGSRAMIPGLIKFGARRMPGDVFVVALMSLPVVLTAHLSNINVAGTLSLAITVIGAVGAFATPLGIVLLPRATMSLTRHTFGPLRREIVVIVVLISVATVLTVPLIVLIPKDVMVLVLDRGYEDVLDVVRQLWIAVWPYAIFIVLRSVIDAYHERAVNGRNAAVALGVLLAFAAVAFQSTRDPNILIIGFDAALLVLGILTLFEVWRIGWRLNGPGTIQT